MSLIHEALEKKLAFPGGETELLDPSADQGSSDFPFDGAESPKRGFFLKEIQWTFYGMIAALIFLSALYFFAVPLYNKYLQKPEVEVSEEKLVEDKGTVNPSEAPPVTQNQVRASFPFFPVSATPPQAALPEVPKVPAPTMPTSVPVSPDPVVVPVAVDYQSLFALTGIAHDRKEWSAIINNKLVRVGEKVSGMSGAQVKVIRDEEVLLDYQGQTVTLALH